MDSLNTLISELSQYFKKNNTDQSIINLIKNVEIFEDNFSIYVENKENKNIISENIKIIKNFAKDKYKKNFRMKILLLDSGNNTNNNIKKNDNNSKLNNDIISNDTEEKNNTIIDKEKVDFLKNSKNRLNKKFTFESFIVGDNSLFAYNVCLAISKNPALNYNPCLLYGDVGLGKTHLVQAVANEIIKNIGLNVYYITCGEFLDEYVSAIRQNKIIEYKNKYKNVDVWIVDDIQYLEGKTNIQEGFFNIFNSLKDANKQIICTSDKSTSSFQNFEARLSSRIGSGIIVELDAPNKETRYAIIDSKFKEQNFNIDDKYKDYIAEHVITNVRDLESTVTTIIGYNLLAGEEINLETIKELIKDKIINDKSNNEINENIIIDSVIKYFGINKKELLGKNRGKTIVFQRDCCAYLMNTLTEMTQTEIGIALGGKTHASIIYSVEKIKKLYQTDKGTKKIIDQIKEDIKRQTI